MTKHKQHSATALSGVAIAMLAVAPLAPASGMMSLSICGADGVTRTVSVPMDPEGQDGDDCAQACHGFCSRKQSPEDSDETGD
ncbi:hypothetical protein [Sphingorhabdus sp. EL138]|jgi:hypothetical protein|uniref:hypothetical protein n=1 Tax=Sphingorhabdus sp. EL138 TaxID=2073156 RepID=UPI000D697F49|nr:hypothetical protein [Sphingorhabdus sp. EL138]